MPRESDSGYFGVRLGDAIATGAGHISEALQRKYAMQRRDEEMARQREEEKAAQNQSTRLSFAKAGIDYDSENPAAAFEAYRAKSAGDISAEDRLREAQIKRTEFQSTPEGQHGGMGGEIPEAGYNFLTGPGGAQYVPTKYGPKFVPGTGAPPNKPLNQFQANAAAGVMAAKKLDSMIESAEGKPIGRFGGIGGTLSQKNLAGKVLRIGDPVAQEFVSTKDEIVDLLARIRTGAVITSNEEKIYANKLYSILQDEGVNRKNIKMIQDYFQRALPKGYNPETLSYDSSDAPSAELPLSPEEKAELEQLRAKRAR